MNRRRFLQILAGTAAASTTAYFLPPIGGWKSDVIAHAPDLQWSIDDGIPYYYSPSTSGEYLGVARGNYPSLIQQKSALDRALASLNEFWTNTREEYRAVIEA